MLKKLLGIMLCVLGTFSLNAMERANDEAVNKLLIGTLSGDAAKQSFREFRSSIKSQKNYYEVYSRFIDKLGVKRISNYLEAEDASCHGIAHALGKVIAERVGDLNQSMQLCGSTCTYACVHGVFKQYFSELGKNYHTHEGESHHAMHDSQPVTLTKSELNKFGETVNATCAQSKTTVDDFFRGNCAHAVGHAMAKLAMDVGLANDYCRVFDSSAMKYYCETGVFMELGSQIKQKIFQSGMRRSEEISVAIKYCSIQSNYPSACFRFLLPRHKSLGHVTRHATLCSRETDALQQHCFNALGYMARTYVAKNPDEINYVCVLAQGESKQACYSGLAFMKKGQRYRQAMFKACGLLVNSSERRYCQQQAGEFYYDLANKGFEKLL